VVDMDVLLNKVAANIESYKPIESSYAFLVDEGGRAVALPDQAFQDILNAHQKKASLASTLAR